MRYLFAALLFFSSFSFAWWDPSFRYQMPLNLTNPGSSLSDFQLNVTVDTASLISQGHMRPDCADARFVDSSDSPVPFWLGSGCNTSSTVFWVRLSSFPAGSSTLYFYYGSPSVLSASDGNLTFLFFDSFDDGNVSDWGKADYYQTTSSASVAAADYYSSPGYSHRIYNKATCSVSPYTGGESVLSRLVSLGPGNYSFGFLTRDKAAMFAFCTSGYVQSRVYINGTQLYSRNCGVSGCGGWVTCDPVRSSFNFTASGSSVNVSLSARTYDCSEGYAWFDDVYIGKYSSSGHSFLFGSEGPSVRDVSNVSSASGGYVASSVDFSGFVPYFIPRHISFFASDAPVTVKSFSASSGVGRVQVFSRLLVNGEPASGTAVNFTLSE